MTLPPQRSVVVVVALFAATTLAGCTSADPSTTPVPISPSGCELGQPGCEAAVETRGVTYEVACQAVPEALVDVDLPKQPGTPRLRAVAGIARSQGIAVLWDQPGGCGLWVLALAEGLTAATASSIRDEVARGVGRFGVTASSLPDDPAAG